MSTYSGRQMAIALGETCMRRHDLVKTSGGEQGKMHAQPCREQFAGYLWQVDIADGAKLLGLIFDVVNPVQSETCMS